MTNSKCISNMLESRESAAVEGCVCGPRDLLALWWCVLGVLGTEEEKPWRFMENVLALLLFGSSFDKITSITYGSYRVRVSV